MMAGRVPARLFLLLVFTGLVIQSVTTSDLYWEGEEDAGDEFLEVDDDQSNIGKIFNRVKRGWWSWDSDDDTTSTTTTTPNPDEEDNIDAEEVDDIFGSGGNIDDVDLKEKTIRVYFVVREPYQSEFSNQDSPQFQNISKSLADAVNALYENLPGSHRASLVRIQSLADQFSCNVTMEIPTSGSSNTESMVAMLKDHIRDQRKLGPIIVDEKGFYSSVFDTVDEHECSNSQYHCSDGRCVDLEKRCDGYPDCLDGGDEMNCNGDPNLNEHNPVDCSEDEYKCADGRCVRKCDGVQDCDSGADEMGCEFDSTDDPACEPDQMMCRNGNCATKCDRNTECDDGSDEAGCVYACESTEMRCDENRCVSLNQKCDGHVDCTDGADERDCPESCGIDDFRCDDGKCIEKSRHCDRVGDCSNFEDEHDCECTQEEFRCVSDGFCIESRKRCDGYAQCADSSDESDCATDQFRCRSGKLIPGKFRCNHRYDCPRGDYSDEKNCPCGKNDFQCGNGHCIPASKHCDGTHDCQDGTDEQKCNNEKAQCMRTQYKCSNNECVQADARCNGIKECQDGSDERDCPCKRDEFHCRNGSCINIALRCDRRRDCPAGDDEHNCGCREDQFTCEDGTCATKCDGIPTCFNGEDESDCQECYHRCDGRCLDENLICDGHEDCYDASDESRCDDCGRPEDFRCDNGQCLSSSQRCNGIEECSDGSDERECETTVTLSPGTCDTDQYQCRDGSCINIAFRCDGKMYDCVDNSDEDDCGNSNPACLSDEFQCASGQCILDSLVCNGYPECSDGSDEVNCPTTQSPYRTTSTSRPPYIYTTTTFPYYYPTQRPTPPPVPEIPRNQAGCSRNQWRCENGPCIDKRKRCDGHVDCLLDDSDELDCPPGSPPALNLKTYPDDQSVRYGGDVVFRCRDEGPIHAPVRWIREGGRPLKVGSTDKNGRLEMFQVTPSDAGVYICQAPSYLGQPGSEKRVILNVEARPNTPRPIQIGSCNPYEATCGNGQCISKSAVCDGKYDCSDKSDETYCSPDNKCQPNEYQCANRRCVLKTWVCDSEDDCGDGSDENNCGTPAPGQPCQNTEFSCRTGGQCVPKSYHCDKQNDCFDGSDEVGCAAIHITLTPKPQNVRANPGDTLTLRCEAVGIPTPLITWRLNWGHIPEKCTSTSENGIGVLTCPNLQPSDSGAYSCEAINNQGTSFAVPDSIVYVNKTDVCPNGYFNSEASSPGECIKCFCFGESTQCSSADLYTYHMPTYLGQGGTRLVGVTQDYSGSVEIDQQPIHDLYFFQPLQNGVTVTKLETYSPRSSHPYVTLPETYNHNQLTSYGGYIKYTVHPHSQRLTYEANVPDIIIKGKFGTLVHNHRHGNERAPVIEARLTPENWRKVTSRGPAPATREDIMMALDDIETILIRADLNGAGVNISDFVMESAQQINAGLGLANLVEQCQCPSGYEGLSCEKCASGYSRQQSGPWLGNCVREEPICPPGTYGSPNAGYGCRPCPCPLTNRENNFARTCSLGYNGRVICDCLPGYEGPNCERCGPGLIGNPNIPGDSCKAAPSDNCNPVGTTEVIQDQCECKENVIGPFCDRCDEGSFYLSEDFRHGCARCFCSGVTQRCESSFYRRKTTSVAFNYPPIADQVKIYNSTISYGQFRYTSPVETNLRPIMYNGELTIQAEGSRPNIYYWSLPASFAGDKVTSYGGYLRYTLRNVPENIRSYLANNASDIQLLSDNTLTFQYFQPTIQASYDGELEASVQFLEKGWQRPDGKEVSREQLLLALADVKTILIKATYGGQISSLVSASIETATPDGDGDQALHVEQCTCPQGYLGTSCEDCAPGYKRNGNGLYLEHCSPCECNSHSSTCDAQTGVCSECADNTAGDNCEFCKPNFIQDRFGNCIPSENEFQPCNCDPRGEAQPCQGNSCVCKQNVEGISCDQCRRGTFGLSEDNVDGCTPCYCSGVADECYEADNYYRVPIPAVVFGENNGGFTITDLRGENVINDHFVPATNESELTYNVLENSRDNDLYWSLPQFPGNRILSYGGHLTLAQRFQAIETPGYPAQSQPSVDAVLVGGDGAMLYWRNPNVLRSREKLAYRIPLVESSWINMESDIPATREEFMNVLKKLERVLIRATLTDDMISTTIADVAMETAAPGGFGTARAKGIEICYCPEGYTGTSCETCKPGYYQDLRGTCTQCPCNGHDCALGAYGQVVCQCRPPYTGTDCASVGGEPITEFTTRPPPPQSTVVVSIKSPKIKIQEVGGTVNFTCQASSRMTQAPLTIYWSKDNGYLPQGRYYTDDQGLLLISNVQVSDSGRYICQASDGISTEQEDVTLRVPGNDLTLPTVTIKPPYSRHYEGDRIELECIARGNPTPTISWQRSLNRPLPFGVRSTESFLIIESAAVEDSGEYRCTATNPAGPVDRTAVIEVIPVGPRPSYQRLTISPSAPNITEGQSTRVICTGTASVPPGSIGWTRKDGTPLQSNMRSNNGVLYIDVARLDNQGIYVCQTANNEVSPVQVIVSVQPNGTPSPLDNPSVSVSINRLSIPTGETRDIECIPSGIPIPTVVWRKNEESFGASTTQRDNTLIISNAQESDAGYYICEGLVNGEPVSQVYVAVDIERREPPSVVIWPGKEQAVPLGGEFEFHCRVTGGIPSPDVTWEKNGRPLSPHVQILPNNILRFDRVEVNDEGEYLCTATNVAGTNRTSAILKVRSPPQITFKPSNYVTILRGDPINIECRATGYPEPMVSITEDSSHREIQPPTPGSAALRVSAATERDDGFYTCTASSPAGTTTEQFAVVIDRYDAGNGPEIEGSGDEPQTNEIPGNQTPESEEPSVIDIYEGADSVLTCDVSNDVEAEWVRGDGQPLQSNALQTAYSLRILNASKSDEGYYECQILDRISHQPLKSKYTYLRVNPADYRNPYVSGPPRITLRPPSQTVSPGQSPRVECIVEGDDILEVVWRPVTKPFSRRVETRGSVLTFHQIEVEDAGHYECFARNRIATATAQADVIVNEDIGHQPVESYEHEQFAHAGATVHLSCNVTQPNLRISWTKDGRSLPRSITQKSDGSLFIRLAQKSDSGYYVCTITDRYGGKSTNYVNLHIEGNSDVSSQPDLVSIDQPRRPFNVGDNVEVTCKARSRDVQVQWERVGTNQYLDAVTYGDGSILRVPGVEESDAGEYRCIGRDPRPNGRTSYDTFMLEVIPRRNLETSYGSHDQETKHVAQLHDNVVLPCYHDLEEPVHIEWRREFVPLPSGVQTNNPNLLLNNVTEKDAGTYVCRVSNSMVAKEARAILQVVGVLPRFDGDSWLSLPTLKDAYRQFNIEISLKPMDKDGLILYNSQNPSPDGDYIALQLVEGVPEFILEPGNGPYFVRGDRPLQLNQWHTIRISRTHNILTMTIDNSAPSVTEVQDEVRREWVPLDLNLPLYIGGVPDPRQLPSQLTSAAGFIGCVSLLILGRDEVNIMTESWERHNIQQCEVCNPNPCLNDGVCQEARNERGYTCLCTAGFAGLNCNRTGEACRPGLCGEGKCTDTAEGFKCSCPVTHTGKRCEIQQQIEYPAFTGSAYLAIKTLAPFRAFKMSMKVKPQPVVADGIIMYCAESARGLGGFISLAVKDGRLQYRYDAGDGNGPVVLNSDRPLPANEWTSVQLSRIAQVVTMTVNNVNSIQGRTKSLKELVLETPLFVGGYDDSIVLNNNTDVTGGFNGCIKDVVIPTGPVDIIHSSIQSANVQECSNTGDRGDIPENDRLCSQCRNNGYCVTADAVACTCPQGYSGVYCEHRVQPTRYSADPCSNEPCRNGGKCKQDPGKGKRIRYSCDCPLGYTGVNCERPLELQHSVGFDGNGYLELPAELVRYDNLEEEPAVVALAVRSTSDGVLLYQGELDTPHGDFILLKVEDSKVVMEWDLGGGVSRLVVEEVSVTDGERHQIIAELLGHRGASLSVDGYSRSGISEGMSTLMNANSNIYIGGIPERMNYGRHPGLMGCFEQVELMNTGRGLNLGQLAAAGWNTKSCRVRY